MSLYEHVYLARQDASAQQVEELTAHLKSVVEGMGGSIAKAEYWGVKSLSYRLRKNRKAHFTLLNLDAPSAAIKKMNPKIEVFDAAFFAKRTDADLAKQIADGKDKMKPFKDNLKPEEIAAVAKYTRTLKQ